MAERNCFRLCGTLQQTYIDCKDISPKTLSYELFDIFHTDGASKLHYHFDNEDCTLRLPWSEIRSYQKIADRTLMVHLDRRIDYGEFAVARVDFRFPDHVDGIDSGIWSDTRMGLNHADTVDDVIGLIQTQIALKVRRQRRLGRNQQLRPANMPEQDRSEVEATQSQSDWVCLKFRTVVHSLDPDSDATLDLDANHAYLNRVHELSDLFEDRDLTRGSLRMTIWIDVSWADPDAKEDIIERLHQPAKPPRHLRIGDTAKQAGGSREIPLEYAALARLTEDKTSVLDFEQLAAWNLGHYCIGDLAEAHPIKFKPGDWILLPDFSGIDARSRLEEAVLKHNFKENRIPILPAMSLSIFENPFPAQLPDGEDVMLVVRLVNHLAAPEAQNLDLDINCQLSAKDDESAAAIIEGAISFMHGYDVTSGGKGKKQKRYPVRSGLLEGALKDQWKCEVWALSQDSQPPVLYRFDEENASVGDFLQQECVDRGELRLYMECHIWPKDEEVLQGL